MTTPSHATDAGEAVRRAIAALQVRLQEAYGWTFLEVDVRSDPRTHRVELEGVVLVDRLIDAVLDAVIDALPAGWSLARTELRLLGGLRWHALQPGVHRLFARRDGRTSGWGAFIELTARDAAVEVLAEDGEVVLVRGRDGTTGWLQQGLGAQVDPPLLTAPTQTDPAAVLARARHFLGVPYRLGGATEEGIDCSALVQQALAEVGVVVPRHSSDQLQIDPCSGAGSNAPGDLLFTWNEAEALCHVGIATGHGIVHASRSRQRVVEDPPEVFGQGARRRMHVGFDALLAFGRRVAGFPSLSAAGFALGRGERTGSRSR